MQPVDIEEIDEDAKKAGKKCPVCGEGEYLHNGYICPICGWEFDSCEDWPDEISAANGITFYEFKERFEKRRKENPKYVWSKFRFSRKYKDE